MIRTEGPQRLKAVSEIFLEAGLTPGDGSTFSGDRRHFRFSFLFLRLDTPPDSLRRRGFALALVDEKVGDFRVEVRSIAGAGNGVVLVRIHLRLEGDFFADERRRQMHGVLKVDVVIGGAVD